MPDVGERRRRPERAPSNARPQGLYAAVDLGTNNCRLLVAEWRPGGFRPVDSLSQAVRLGEGLARENRLTDAAMARGISALTAIREKLKGRGVGKVRCVATQACRAAENGADFIARVQEETGLSFKVIDPREEARLAVIGCHNLFDPKADIACVVDIGGGSTELSWVDVRASRGNGLKGFLNRTPILDWASFPLGVVTLTEAFIHLPEAERYPAMLAHARKLVGEKVFRDEVHQRAGREHMHLVGTSGTVTSLAAMHLDLPRYSRAAVDGLWMGREDARTVCDTLAGMTLEQRRGVTCIGEDRSELILAGCAILEAVFLSWPCERIRVADRGLREGLLLSMMHGKKTRRRRRGGRGRNRGGDGNDEHGGEGA